MNSTLEPLYTVDRALVDSGVAYARLGLGRFLTTLSYIPADQLDLKLSPTAKSPREIALHVALAYQVMGSIFLAPLAEDHPLVAELPTVAPDATKEALADVVRRNGEYIVDAVAALTTEDLDTVVDTPFAGPIPVRHILLIPGRHLDSHAAQLDFIQTTWDDQENHM